MCCKFVSAIGVHDLPDEEAAKSEANKLARALRKERPELIGKHYSPLAWRSVEPSYAFLDRSPSRRHRRPPWPPLRSSRAQFPGYSPKLPGSSLNW
jgi:hypothetical protein